MESYPADKFSSPLNLIDCEDASLKNLKFLIFITVGYNYSKSIDPWHPSLLEKN